MSVLQVYLYYICLYSMHVCTVCISVLCVCPYPICMSVPYVCLYHMYACAVCMNYRMQVCTVCMYVQYSYMCVCMYVCMYKQCHNFNIGLLTLTYAIAHWLTSNFDTHKDYVKEWVKTGLITKPSSSGRIKMQFFLVKTEKIQYNPVLQDLTPTPSQGDQSNTKKVREQQSTNQISCMKQKIITTAHHFFLLISLISLPVLIILMNISTQTKVVPTYLRYVHKVDGHIFAV